jgi:type II secretion system protein G
MKALAIIVLFSSLQDTPKAPSSRDEVLKQDVEAAIKKLGSERRTESNEAWVDLVELGRRAVPAVTAELNKKETIPAVKRALCEILGRARDPQKDAVAALTARLKDTDEFGTTIAAAAARALAEIGDESSAPALLEALNSKIVETDRLLKVECIRALGLMRSKEAVEPLRKALEDKRTASLGEGDDEAPLIAAAAADALGLIRGQEAADELGKLLSDSQVNAATGLGLGLHAARALRRILDPELKGKAEKDDARAAAFTGDAAADAKALDAWKKWWEERKDKKDVAETRAVLEKVAAAVEAYKKDQGRYPEILAYLQKAPTDAKNFPKDGYYKGDLKDSWGRPFIYACPGTGNGFDVVSRGKDGAPWGSGVQADLWSHDKWVEVKKAETRKAIEEAVKVIQKFKEDNSTLPRQIGDLVTRPQAYAVPKWPEKGYLQAIPKDGFEKYLVYRLPGTGDEPFDLLSYGADGVEGGTGADEDLWNHNKRPKKEEPKKDEKKDEKK